MPTPHDAVLRIEPPAPAPVPVAGACPDAERSDARDWPALRSPPISPLPAPGHALMSPSPASPPDAGTPAGADGAPLPPPPPPPDASPRERPASGEMSPPPKVRDVESGDSLLARTIQSPAAEYLSRDPNPSPSAYPAILPPPPRPFYTSSYLRPGSRFVGKQQSDKQQYEVEVTFKSVDLKESFLCGYLRIQDLTKDHPTLTTYFEGEIIGSKYTFQTKHEAWGATEKTDMQHWNRFPAWRPLANQAKRSDFNYKNYMDKENIFMRWKEYFLVPDHRVREIHGASFEGFYYICFNQVKGVVSGIYFHAKSEKFQQLELRFVPDMGGFAAIEFR